MKLPRSDKNAIQPLKLIQPLLLIVLLFIFGCGGGGGSGGSEDNPSVIANAGADQTIDEATFVTLDGTGSTGNITSYTWRQVAGPPVSLINGDTATANYMAPMLAVPTVLVFRLVVSDNNGDNSSDQTTNTVVPVFSPPTADAGADQFAPAQTLVTLDGSSSSDSDGTIENYSWSQTGGTDVSLNNSNTATPSFTAPTVTELLTFKLTVTDNEGDTDSDEVNVSVSEMLFSDDFNDGNANGWSVVDDSGNTSAWAVNGGGYRQANYVESITPPGDPFDQSYHRGTYSYPNTGTGWSSYRFSAEMTPLLDSSANITEGNDVGLMFRYQDPSNYYRLTLSSRYGFSRLEKKVGGTFSTLAVDSAGYNERETLGVAIEVNGPLIQVYIDEEPLFSVYDSDLSSGTIALYCQDKATFDNVIITDNSLLPAVVISSPVAYSIEVSDTFVASAVTTNVPSGGKVEFVLDDDDSTAQSASCPPCQVQFSSVSQGEHKLDAILRDASDLELARDTNDAIGVLGDYYIAVGDSITNGIGDNYSSDNVSQDGRTIAIQGYEANLNDLLTSTLTYPHIVFNEGIGGDSSQATANNRIDSILERHPGASGSLILLGTIDATNGPVSTSQYKSNMQALVDEVVLSGKDAWVALIPPVFQSNGTPNSVVNQRIVDYNDVIVDDLLDIQVGPDFYDYFLGSGTNRSSLFADELHPNGLGHAVMAYLWHKDLNPDSPLPFPLILEQFTPLSYKQNLLEVGDKYYIDESFALISIPSVLEDSVWIMTANADENNNDANYLSFEVDRSVTVYVAYDAGAGTLPNWLSSLFTDTGLQVGTTNGSLRLYSRNYPASSTIILGGNRAGGGSGDSNYVVIVSEN